MYQNSYKSCSSNFGLTWYLGAVWNRWPWRAQLGGFDPQLLLLYKGKLPHFSLAFLRQNGQSQNPLAGRPLSTLKLVYEHRLILVRIFSVEKPLILFMVEGLVFSVFNLRPSNRVISLFIAVWSVEGCEFGLVFIAPPSVEISESVRLRLRPPSPVQSSPFLLCLVFCPCSPCAVLCFRSCVFICVCPCFLYCLFSCSRLCFSVLPVSCPSQSCLCSCQCVVRSESCCPNSPSAFNLPQLKVSAVRYLSGAPKVTNMLYFPNVICWCSCDLLVSRKLIHAVVSNSLALVARTSSVVSFGAGGGRPGCRGNPGSLSYGDCMEGCRAGCSSRSIGRGVPCPADDGVALACCGVPYPACSLPCVPLSGLPVLSLRCSSLLFVSLLGLPGSSLRCSLACCLGCFAVDQVVARKRFYETMARGSGDCLHCCINLCVAQLNNHGLRHAGEMHSSILPDSVMEGEDGDVGDLQSPRHIGLGIYKFDGACFGAMVGSPTMAAHTPRTDNWIFKFGRHNCNCLDHGIRLSVAKALGHPLVRMSLGGGGRRGGGKSHPWAQSPNAQNSSRGGHIRCLANRLPSGAGGSRANDCTQKLWLDARLCPP